MCWSINKIECESNPEKYHKIAEEDITVYKFGVQNSNIFLSIYQTNFWYEPNKSNKLIKLEWLEFNQVIREGYHSYSGECKIDNINIVHDPNVFKIYSKDKKNNKYVINAYVHEKIGVFIIPKGTEYYENEKGEIVSSTIIWTGNCNINEDLREEFQEIKIKDYVLESK